MARFDLNGATAIVTGGSRGIGPFIATALAQRGARVAMIARSQSELEATAHDATLRSSLRFRTEPSATRSAPPKGR